jgi:hypothetical protein
VFSWISFNAMLNFLVIGISLCAGIWKFWEIA